MNPQQAAKTFWITVQSCAIYLSAAAASAGAFGDNDHFFAWFSRVWAIWLVAFIAAGGNAQFQRRNDPPPNPLPGK